MAASLGAAFAIGHTPGIKDLVARRQEVSKLQKQQKVLAKAEEQGDLPVDQQQEYRNKRIQAAEQAFEISPNKETYQAMTEAQTKLSPHIVPAYEGPMDYYGTEEYQQEVAQEAEQRKYQQLREADIVNSLQTAIESKQGVKNAVKERRSFLKAMQDQPVSFGKNSGGKFGDLDPKVQKEIAKQYTKGERKKVMDEYYGK